MISYKAIRYTYLFLNITGGFATLLIGIANLILISSEFETNGIVKACLIFLSVILGLFVISEAFVLLLPFDIGKLASLVIAILGDAVLWYFTFHGGDVLGFPVKAGLLFLGTVNFINGAICIYEFFLLPFARLKKD